MALVLQPLCYFGTGSSALASIASDPDFVMPLPRAAITRTTDHGYGYLVVLQPSAVRIRPRLTFPLSLRIVCRFVR